MCNDNDETALHAAASNNHTDVVEYVITQQRARLDDVDEYSRTPLFVAASQGHLDVVKKLIEFDAATNIGYKFMEKNSKREKKLFYS